MTAHEALFRETALHFFFPPGINEVCVPLCWQAQSLLRWHDSHQYCSKTGQPTQKNAAGSKRVCHASGVTYYPQVSPGSKGGAHRDGSAGKGKRENQLCTAGYFVVSHDTQPARKSKNLHLFSLNLFWFVVHMADVPSGDHPGVRREPLPPRPTALVPSGDVHGSVRLL